MNWHVCTSQIIPLTISNDITVLRSRAAPQQPSTTKQNSRVKMKPRHQTRQWSGKGSECETIKREEWNANYGAVVEVSEKLLCLAFQSVTDVLLSSFHFPSVKTARPISYKKVRVCCQDTMISVTVSQCDSFSHLLSLLSCLYGLDLSPQSMSLFPVRFDEMTDGLLPRKRSEKWKDIKRLVELKVEEKKEWKGET